MSIKFRPLMLLILVMVVGLFFLAAFTVTHALMCLECDPGGGGDGDPGPITCGDNVCNSSIGENSSTCPYDCPGGAGFCGDGVCNAGEDTNSCSSDCGTGSSGFTAPDVDVQLGDAGKSSPSHPGDC